MQAFHLFNEEANTFLSRQIISFKLQSIGSGAIVGRLAPHAHLPQRHRPATQLIHRGRSQHLPTTQWVPPPSSNCCETPAQPTLSSISSIRGCADQSLAACHDPACAVFPRAFGTWSHLPVFPRYSSATPGIAASAACQCTASCFPSPSPAPAGGSACPVRACAAAPCSPYPPSHHACPSGPGWSG